MSSAMKENGAGIEKKCERRHHVIEDAPHVKAPTSSKVITIGINWIKITIKFQEELQFKISISEIMPLAKPSEQDKSK